MNMSFPGWHLHCSADANRTGPKADSVHRECYPRHRRCFRQRSSTRGPANQFSIRAMDAAHSTLPPLESQASECKQERFGRHQINGTILVMPIGTAVDMPNGG